MSVSLLNNANTSTNPGSSSPVIASLESSSINNNNNNNNTNNNSNNSVSSELAYAQHPYSQPTMNALLNNNPSGVLQHFHSQQHQHQHQQAINNIHANYQINKRFKNDQYEFSNYQYMNSQNSSNNNNNNNNQQIQHSLNENANTASLLSLKKAQQVKDLFLNKNVANNEKTIRARRIIFFGIN